MADPIAGAGVAVHAALAPSFTWGKGELISMAFGAIFAVAGCAMNRKAITKDKFFGYVSNGIAFGPLAMIVIDPINRTLPLVDFDLFDVAMREARVTLWWAAMMASLYMLTTVFPQKP